MSVCRSQELVRLGSGTGMELSRMIPTDSEFSIIESIVN
jgi:hypothetical protein